MPQSFVVCIPSYKRPTILRDKTLRFLLAEGVDPETITIFVADEEEKKVYRDTLLKGMYREIVVGVLGIAAQRTFIRSYYAPGTRVLSLDDDIRGVKLLSPRPFKRVVEQMFELTVEEKLTTFSFYPVNNLYFCRERVIRGLTYNIACCYGFICAPLSYPDVPTVEDFWYSLERYSRDGATLRYEGACADTVYYAKGGLTDVRTAEREKKDSETVHTLFPFLCQVITKKNGHTNPKIKRIVERELYLTTE